MEFSADELDQVVRVVRVIANVAVPVNPDAVDGEGTHQEPRLLVHLTNSAIGRVLPRLEVPAGDIPVAKVWIDAAPAKEHLAILDHEGARARLGVLPVLRAARQTDLPEKTIIRLFGVW
jgi:hypothetical protein